MEYSVQLEAAFEIIDAKFSFYAHKGLQPKEYDVVCESKHWKHGYYRAIVTVGKVESLKKKIKIGWIKIDLTHSASFYINGERFQYEDGDFTEILKQRDWPFNSVDEGICLIS